ncbi:MAG TPA: universal stress protein [Terriglobia bacterium]|nr:universal stress protein [Terriglobia bacterium]
MSEAKVLVALRDADHVDGLMRLAWEMSKGMNAGVTALNVVEVGPGLPLDAESDVLDQSGKEALARAQKSAEENSIELSTRLVRARDAGHAIVHEAEEDRDDLLILGYHHKPALEEVILGSTVQYVARHAPCRMIVEVLPPRHNQP